MNGFRDKPMATNRVLEAKASGLSSRLDKLEERTQQMELIIGQVVQQISTQLGRMDEVLNAAVEELGPDHIRELIEARRLAISTERDRLKKEALDKSLTDGTMVKADTITEDSTIVGVEKDPQGQAIPPGRTQVKFEEVSPEYKSQLLGKGVGASFITNPRDDTGKPLPSGSFEVTEVYMPVAKAIQLEEGPLTAAVEAALAAPIVAEPVPSDKAVE